MHTQVAKSRATPLPVRCRNPKCDKTRADFSTDHGWRCHCNVCGVPKSKEHVQKFAESLRQYEHVESCPVCGYDASSAKSSQYSVRQALIRRHIENNSCQLDHSEKSRQYPIEEPCGCGYEGSGKTNGVIQASLRAHKKKCPGIPWDREEINPRTGKPFKHPPWMRENNSNALKGKASRPAGWKHTPEAIAKMSGENNVHYGKHLSDDHRKAVVEGMRKSAAVQARKVTELRPPCKHCGRKADTFNVKQICLKNLALNKHEEKCDGTPYDPYPEIEPPCACGMTIYNSQIADRRLRKLSQQLRRHKKSCPVLRGSPRSSPHTPAHIYLTRVVMFELAWKMGKAIDLAGRGIIYMTNGHPSGYPDSDRYIRAGDFAGFAWKTRDKYPSPIRLESYIFKRLAEWGLDIDRKHEIIFNIELKPLIRLIRKAIKEYHKSAEQDWT